MTDKPRMSWTQPCCESCWSERNDRAPVRLVPSARQVERCVYCNERTKSGIYVRVDPKQAPYPTRLKGD